MSNLTIKQHFVPRCLLKNFTANDVVNIYDSYREKLRDPSNVEGVLFEKYFYDRDNLVENFLDNYIEKPAGRVFNIIRGELNAPIGIDEQQAILRFILVQLNRTPSALSTSLNSLYSLMDDIIEQIGSLNGFSKDITDEIKFTLNDPKDLLRAQTINSVLDAPLLLDLKWHFIINGTDRDFFISDNPVIHYNWYLRKHKSIDSGGLTKRGVQVFLPLSNRVTLCLYDSQVYKVGKKGKNYTVLDNISDVNLLNEFQFRNRKSYIVFTQREDSNYVINSCNRFPGDSLYFDNKDSSNPVFCGNEAQSMMVQWRTSYEFNRWFSFSKIKKKYSKKKVQCEDRSPELLLLHQHEMEKLIASKHQS